MRKTCKECNKTFDGDATDEKCRWCYTKSGCAILGGIFILVFTVVFAVVSAMGLGTILFWR